VVGPPMLECKKVSFFYHQAQILYDVSFRALAGELLGVVGPNGSGKTTLLKILYRALEPTGGEVLLNGHQRLHRLKRQEIAHRIAVMGQEPALQFPITVFELVMQGRYPHLRGLGFERDEDQEQVLRALKQTDLLELAPRRVEETSGGERRRMLLARAIAQAPEILLLDEPTVNLDIYYQLELFTLIRDLTRTQKLCTVLVTHDINLISEFADRVILLKAGRIFRAGTPREVLTAGHIQAVFNIDVLVDENPSSGNPRISHRVTVPVSPMKGKV